MTKLRFVLLGALALGVSLLIGCDKPTAADACVGFLAYIDAGDYASAYELLHSSVRYDEQRRADDELQGKAQPLKRISKDEFVNKYKNIFELLQIDGVTIQGIEAIGEGEAICVYDYTLIYKSSLLTFEPMDFRMTVRVEDGLWHVEWDPSLMMPDMEWGDTVRVGNVDAVRGEILADGIAYSRSVNAVSICAVPERICPAKESLETEEEYAARREDAFSRFARQITLILPDLKAETIIRQLGGANALVILKQIYPDEYTSALESELLSIEGVSIDSSNFGTLRDHPQGSSLAHIIGYVGSATKEEAEALNGVTPDAPENAGDAAQTPEAGANGEAANGEAANGEIANDEAANDEAANGVANDEAANDETQNGETAADNAAIQNTLARRLSMSTAQTSPSAQTDDNPLDISSNRPTPSPTPDAIGEDSSEAGAYSIHSIIGKSGLERAYEKELRGKDGYFIYICTRTGENKRTIYRTPTANGLDIRLTIDPDLQKMTEDLLKYSLFGVDTAGAVVVMDPNTGRIDAMAAYPSYDLNSFTRGISSEEWSRLNDIEQSNRPLYNRLTQGLYPPGSTFKPFTAAAALNSGAIGPDTVFPTNRETIVIDKDRKTEYWRPSDTGEFGPWNYAIITRAEFRLRRDPLNMHHGIIYSDNIYFAYIALKMGADAFRSYIEPIGFTQSIPFDGLSVSKPQLAKESSVWSPMLLAESAFGQGEMLITPLQAACMFSAFANGGDIMVPHIVDGLYRAVGPTYEPVQVTKPSVWKSGVISKKALDILVPMLEDVSVTGTAQWLKLDSTMRIASKTGTAQLGGGRDINWFVGYKMDGKPRLVLVMLEVPDNDVFNQAKFDIARALFLDAYEKENAAASD